MRNAKSISCEKYLDAPLGVLLVVGVYWIGLASRFDGGNGTGDAGGINGADDATQAFEAGFGVASLTTT